jgi:hypothetical protein
MLEQGCHVGMLGFSQGGVVAYLAGLHLSRITRVSKHRGTFYGSFCLHMAGFYTRFAYAAIHGTLSDMCTAYFRERMSDDAFVEEIQRSTVAFVPSESGVEDGTITRDITRLARFWLTNQKHAERPMLLIAWSRDDSVASHKWTDTLKTFGFTSRPQDIRIKFSNAQRESRGIVRGQMWIYRPLAKLQVRMQTEKDIFDDTPSV